MNLNEQIIQSVGVCDAGQKECVEGEMGKIDVSSRKKRVCSSQTRRPASAINGALSVYYNHHEV